MGENVVEGGRGEFVEVKWSFQKISWSVKIIAFTHFELLLLLIRCLPFINEKG